jgi:hypothetical protein
MFGANALITPFQGLDKYLSIDIIDGLHPSLRYLALSGLN